VSIGMIIIETIDAIQEKIFQYDVKETGSMLAGLIEQLSSLLPGLEEQRITDLNDILSTMMAALQNADYLLVADLLKYELEPYVRRSLS
jgi:hypothetical protein